MDTNNIRKENTNIRESKQEPGSAEDYDRDKDPRDERQWLLKQK